MQSARAPKNNYAWLEMLQKPHKRHYALIYVCMLGACGKGTPVTSGTATPIPFHPSITSEYTVPTAASRPIGITTDSSGNIWFTEYGAGKLGELTISGVVSTPEPRTPTANAGPSGIATGPNQLLWFAETNVGKVGQISSTTPPVVTEFLLSNTARPTAVTLGSDGNVWVTDPGTNAIWKVSQKGVVGPPCLLPAHANPTSIVTGSDGALWFTEAGINKMGRLPVTNTSACGTVTHFNVPTRNAGLKTVVEGADGAIWFTESAARKLGRMIAGSVVAEYSLNPAIEPSGLVEGLDNNFYFTDPASNQIGRFVTYSQKVTMFKIPTANAQPGALIIGPGEQIYFVETAGNKIGQFKYFFE